MAYRGQKLVTTWVLWPRSRLTCLPVTNMLHAPTFGYGPGLPNLSSGGISL